MSLNVYIEIFDLLSSLGSDISERNFGILARKIAISEILQPKLTKLAFDNSKLNKLAFDTRRIDPLVTMNPRRGLQNYSRSEDFISEGMVTKLANFRKLEGILQNIKSKFGREQEWHDSNARVLLQNLEAGLRTNIKDGDYSDTQPGTGNLNYIDQLLSFRYRLTEEDLSKMSSQELEKIILSKDDTLTKRDPINPELITKGDVSNNNYNDLIVKLLENLKASIESPEVSRTLSITITDKIIK